MRRLAFALALLSPLSAYAQPQPPMPTVSGPPSSEAQQSALADANAALGQEVMDNLNERLRMRATITAMQRQIDALKAQVAAAKPAEKPPEGEQKKP